MLLSWPIVYKKENNTIERLCASLLNSALFWALDDLLAFSFCSLHVKGKRKERENSATIWEGKGLGRTSQRRGVDERERL